MSLASKALEAAKPAWMILVVGGMIAVASGNAEPYVSPAQLPGSSPVVFGGAAALVVAGWIAIGLLEGLLRSRGWKRAGKAARLTSEGGGLFGTPELAGAVGGREVRARTLSRKSSRAGGKTGSKMTRYTVVEASLDGPAEGGLVVTPGGDGGILSRPSSLELDPGHVEAQAGDGLATVEQAGLTVVGTSEPVARAVVSGRPGEEIRTLEGLNLVYVGDASAVISTFLPDADEVGSGLGGAIQGAMMDRVEGAFVDHVPGDASTVSLETEGVVTDGEELRRQVEAVVTIADVFEEATAEDEDFA